MEGSDSSEDTLDYVARRNMDIMITWQRIKTEGQAGWQDEASHTLFLILFSNVTNPIPLRTGHIHGDAKPP